VSAPTVGDAKARALVRLPDGRTARLTYLPHPDIARRTGTRPDGRRRGRAKTMAHVQLPGGAYLCYRPDELEVVG
jgi:hypothetical protein